MTIWNRYSWQSHVKIIALTRLFIAHLSLIFETLKKFPFWFFQYELETTYSTKDGAYSRSICKE